MTLVLNLQSTAAADPVLADIIAVDGFNTKDACFLMHYHLSPPDMLHEAAYRVGAYDSVRAKPGKGAEEKLQ